MKIFYYLIGMIIFASCATTKKPVASGFSAEQANTYLYDAARQYQVLMKRLPAGRFPRNYDPKTDSLHTSNSSWWCSGFYPGSLLLLFEQTTEAILFREAERMLVLLEKEKNNTGTHDLGFMMYNSFGNAKRIRQTREHDEILLTSAKSLLTRFNPKVGSIRSWNSKAEDFLVIIDNMMNLKLLFEATRMSGDSVYYKAAVTHANTTIKNHFRPDNSSYHVLNYDPITGNIKEKRTAQGYSNESAWARGQAWGLYGFTEAYRETRDINYLRQAKKIADFLLDHPNMPGDKIPYWDFNDPSIPNALRDASAAAIMASALLELSTFLKEDEKKYFNAAETIIKTLSSPKYRAASGSNGGFIMMHGVGHLPNKSEVDVALTYADYYYIESLIRYKNWPSIK